MRYGLGAFLALPLVMAFLGCSSMSTTQKGQQSGDWEELLAVWSVVPFAIRLRGLSLVVRSEREAALLLETNSRATRKCSNNSKKRLIGKVSELRRQREELQRLKKQGEY
jgi:hypothetical protein